MRLIHVLSGEVSGSGKLRARAAFWFPRSVNAPTWVAFPETSQVPYATAVEVEAIRRGTVTERVVVSDWTENALDVAGVGALLVLQYVAVSQELANESSLAAAIGGYVHDGVSWAQSAPLAIPELATAQSRPVTTGRRGQTDTASVLSELQSMNEKLLMLLTIIAEKN